MDWKAAVAGKSQKEINRMVFAAYEEGYRRIEEEKMANLAASSDEQLLSAFLGLLLPVEGQTSGVDYAWEDHEEMDKELDVYVLKRAAHRLTVSK